MKLSEAQICWFRLRRSGLAQPFVSPEAAASALIGIQAQILPAAGLAIWNRTPRLTYDEFDRLLHEERSLVKLWGQRGALHVYASDEWPLICGAMADQRTWWERRIEAEGNTDAYDATLARVAKMLRRRGSMGRGDLRAADPGLDEELFSSWGGIFAALVQRGYACHAGRAGSEGLFAYREHWLPDLDWNPPPAEEANIELTRRYLRAYGPASVKDLIHWRCAKAADARRWIAALSGETAEVNVGGQAMLTLRADLDALYEKPPERTAWPLKLLYRFDPLLLGIKDKAWIMDLRHYKRVFRIAGDIEGTLLERGRIAGTWRYDRKGSGLVISFFPFSSLSARVRAAVEECAHGVARFFGLPLADLVIEQDA